MNNWGRLGLMTLSISKNIAYGPATNPTFYCCLGYIILTLLDKRH